jgi:hypothetical protein
MPSCALQALLEAQLGSGQGPAANLPLACKLLNNVKHVALQRVGAGGQANAVAITLFIMSAGSPQRDTHPLRGQKM